MLNVSRYKPDGTFGGTPGLELIFQIKADGSPVASGDTVVIGFSLPSSAAPIVSINADVGGASPSPLSEDGNSAGAPAAGSTLRFWSADLTNGATHLTITLTGDMFMEPVIYVISGMATSSHIGTLATREGSSFVEGQPSVDVDTTTPNEAIIALIELSVGSSVGSPTAGFTLLPGGATSSSFHGMDDDDVGAAGTRSVGVTGVSGGWRITAIPYKSAGGGGGGNTAPIAWIQA